MLAAIVRQQIVGARASANCPLRRYSCKLSEAGFAGALRSRSDFDTQ